MVPQVSSSGGTALTKESGGNVTRPVSFTVPVTAWSALVSSKIEIEPVIVSCAPACLLADGGPSPKRQRPRRSRRMASTRPPKTYSPSARTGRRGGWSGRVAGMVRRTGCDSSAGSISRF